MKKNRLHTIIRAAGLFGLSLLVSLTVSCKKSKAPSPGQYQKQLADMAKETNSKCPKPMGEKGDTLLSVTFDNNTLTYRLRISDEKIAKMNKNYIDETIRDSLIKNTSERMKSFLVKGRCDLVYKYISPNDSCSLTIIPKELDNGGSDKQ